MMHAASRRRFARTGPFAPGALALAERLEPRTLFSAAPTATPAQLVAQANDAFAFDMLHELGPDKSGNLFFSPYSAATALEMALQGAEGTTASEMIQALHLPSSEIAQAGIQALYQLFQATSATAGYTISTANRLWVNEHIPLLNSFLSSSKAVFGAGPEPVDFSNPTAAANTINTWVADQTDGKITNLIPASDLSQFTELVLTNAIYFQGDWADAFDPGITDTKPFQISPTEAATVSLMQQTSDFGYYAQSGANGFQALQLPYVGNELDMLVVLPTTYDLASFESSLTPSLFSTITSNLATADVDVQLPKFQLNETYDLVKPLEALGIETAFSLAADFSGISNTPMMISDVVQKSFINVNETGTTAAAATGVVGITAVSTPTPDPNLVSFDADHPFVFAIYDNATNTILFLGSMADPSNGTADYATNATALPPLPVSSGPSTGGDDPTPAPVPTPAPTPTTPAPTPTTPAAYAISATVREAFTAALASTTLPTLPDGARRGVTVRWGDASHSAGTLTPDGNAFTITGRHRYRSRRKFKVTIDVWQKLHGKLTILTAFTTTASVTAAAD